MGKLVRFGVSLDKDLLEKLDALMKDKGYTNRSEYLRDLARDELVKKQWDKNEEVVATLTIVYDHHKRQLMEKLTDLQHDYGHAILVSQHIHIDHHNCLEIIAVRSKANDIQELANKIRAVKGVKHSSLNMTSSGEGLIL